MTGIGTLGREAVRTLPESAVVWVNGRQASIARISPNGATSTCELERGLEGEPAYLAGVVRAIGDCERVVILGPGSARLALEREYVAVYHRPERLVDVEPAGPMTRVELVERLRALVD